MDKLAFGILKVYGNEYQGTNGRKSFEVEVAKMAKDEEPYGYIENQFRVVAIIEDNRDYYPRELRVGDYVNMNYDDVYTFEESSDSVIEEKYKAMKKEEENSPWIYEGRRTEDDGNGVFCEVGTSEKIVIKGPKSLDEAEKWAFENRPDLYLGCVIYRDFQCGGTLCNAVADYYKATLGMESVKEILYKIAKEKGYCTDKIEELYPEKEEPELC